MITGITDKDQRAYVRTLLRQGWSCCQTGGNHIRLTSPGGSVVFCSLTSSSVRTVHHLRAQVRRVLRQEVLR